MAKKPYYFLNSGKFFILIMLLNSFFFNERYGLGFILWNVDNNYCSEITNLREKTLASKQGYLGYLTPATHLHGWWHLLAGYATYVHILNCIQQRLHFLKIDYHLTSSLLVGLNLEIHPVQRLKLLKSKHYQDWSLPRDANVEHEFSEFKPFRR